MTTHASANLIFLNKLEAQVSHELESRFKVLQNAASEHLETLKRVLEVVDPRPLDLAAHPLDLPNAAAIVWAGVAETLVRSCLDQILIYEEGVSERYLNQEDIISKWRKAHDDGRLAKQWGLTLNDLGFALRVVVSLLGKRETWQGSPELKRDGRLYRVIPTEKQELRITSRPLVS